MNKFKCLFCEDTYTADRVDVNAEIKAIVWKEVKSENTL